MKHRLISLYLETHRHVDNDSLIEMHEKKYLRPQDVAICWVYYRSPELFFFAISRLEIVWDIIFKTDIRGYVWEEFIKDVTNFTLIGNDFFIFFQYDIIIRRLFRGKKRLDGFPKLLIFYPSFTAFTKVGSLRFLINRCRDIPLYPVYNKSTVMSSRQTNSAIFKILWVVFDEKSNWKVHFLYIWKNLQSYGCHQQNKELKLRSPHFSVPYIDISISNLSDYTLNNMLCEVLFSHWKPIWWIDKFED